MKLIYAIINSDDSPAVAAALTKEGYLSTRLASMGNFLTMGNVTFLIASESDKVEKAIEIIKKYSRKRTQAVPSAATYDMGVAYPVPMEVTVGGATIFVTDIERFEKV